MEKQEKEKNEKPKPTKKIRWWIWPITVFVVAVILSFSFSVLSELALNGAVIAVAVVVILVFIAISILFDVLGLAVASCSVEPFTAMSARKVKGAKQALALIKNANKVNSICCDVVGDVCGILSGAAGASILAKIVMDSNGFLPILVSGIISAIIAGLTIGGKAAFKRIAIKYCDKITLGLAKFLNFFTRKG